MGGFLTGKKYSSQNSIKFGSSEKSPWISSPHHMSWLNDKTHCSLTKQERKNPESRTLLSPEWKHLSAKGHVSCGELLPLILKNEVASSSIVTVESKNSCSVMQADDKSTLREGAGACHALKTHPTKRRSSHLKEQLNS